MLIKTDDSLHRVHKFVAYVIMFNTHDQFEKSPNMVNKLHKETQQIYKYFEILKILL